MQKFSHDTVVVLDFGAQYSQLIARRVRELHVYSQIVPYTISAEELKQMQPKGIIFSGGPASVSAEGSPRPDAAIYDLGIPILGICYGLQVLSVQNGGSVQRPEKREYGFADLQLLGKDSVLLRGISENSRVWMSHGDSVMSIPAGFETTGSTFNCPYTVIENAGKQFYGVQFHPEVVHSAQGKQILSNFVLTVCKAATDWDMGSFVNTAIEDIRSKVGDKQVLCGLSGGVDSAVAAVLIHRAIGDQLVCVFVNNGLLRKGEAEMVQKVFRDNYNIRLQYADAEQAFLSALHGVSEPEAKRKIIGKLFVDTFYNEARNAGEISFLAQGTLYPDVIESKSPSGGPSATIKSHHNVGGLPEDLKWELLEPLRELFKDEVRQLGRELGLPEEMVTRHPFPGPGLGVRCVGEITKERLDTLRDVDAIFIDEIRKAGLYDDIWQALACLLPVKSVGVQGDERTYEEVCSLRAVTSEDAMTADWFRFPPEVLQRASSRICNEVSGVNRVLYDITSKPPGTIEWE
ncbi:GMP synthase (glutamine-hydrolyzing) [Sphaerochaeta pleomorpha str. Grapes]|uniref:GMP synthase [glutamine-hydrolyzing] n=1 Tax=Sphaerochaeta pleomorpha (strain ATCC BAA-1885 / DSM 22778 / Grapes) TaxID=158190 RepID=G8QSM7_SPHPG|nr:glutamine-hydrolyzing GMP synthase [Sphaerochaeta pleomorpha]AEV28988.1 GMP synthase (glutamine-hydrolyzing) [Sphaerochaeta pleomorpha str. Grapes]